MDNPSLEVIKEIKQRLPNGVTLIDFFTEIIPMKKEAAYRRLRGEIPLTLKEVLQVVSYFHLSLDKIFKTKEEGTYTSSIVRMSGKNLTDAYCKTIENIINAMRFMKMDPNANMYGAINVLPASHVYKYPTICKFRFFKWAYQCRKTPSPLKFSEIEIPPHIRSLEKIYLEEHQQIASHFIWTKELFRPIINDIHYFSEIGLVAHEEVKTLKEEIYMLLDDLEEDISSGETKAGAPFWVYLANTYFDANYIYVEGNNFKASSINVFGINYLSSIEEEICNDTKEWIESLMRFSTLISKSGEIEKVNFFNLQRKLVEKPDITNIYDIYT
ncbi:MAG: hypothetical protein LBV72_12065 [Tannerella sp.]|jgi:hypothetical protein|nr:hypothetical protein [Tannerella sp.]